MAHYHYAGETMRIDRPNSTCRRGVGQLARLSVLAAVVLFAAACATTPPAQDEQRVTELIDLLNSGPIESVIAQSSVPFLFDAELIVREGDVEFLWHGLRSANLVVAPVFDALVPVESSDFRRIADTFDLRTFFAENGYLPRDATWIETDSSIGPVLLILGGRGGQLPLIHGFVRVDR